MQRTQDSGLIHNTFHYVEKCGQENREVGNKNVSVAPSEGNQNVGSWKALELNIQIEYWPFGPNWFPGQVIVVCESEFYSYIWSGHCPFV